MIKISFITIYSRNLKILSLIVDILDALPVKEKTVTETSTQTKIYKATNKTWIKLLIIDMMEISMGQNICIGVEVRTYTKVLDN